MAISKIAGQMLKDNLERDGANLAISDTEADTPVVFVDIVNSRVGINNNSPLVELDIAGNINATSIVITEDVSANTLTVTDNAVIAGVTIT